MSLSRRLCRKPVFKCQPRECNKLETISQRSHSGTRGTKTHVNGANSSSPESSQNAAAASLNQAGDSRLQRDLFFSQEHHFEKSDGACVPDCLCQTFPLWSFMVFHVPSQLLIPSLHYGKICLDHHISQKSWSREAVYLCIPCSQRPPTSGR